jgi:hypothetical protein
MEIVLNVAWALCSLGLICFWTRSTASTQVSRRTQVLALAMVVLLLLPVISLSDDLMAMQGPAESDACLRRALHSDSAHFSAVPTSFALPELVVSSLALSGASQEVSEDLSLMPPTVFLTRCLDSRPPPQV